MLAPVLLLILTFFFLHRVVTRSGPYNCQPVVTLSGIAFDMKLNLGITPLHNTVKGTVVCGEGTIHTPVVFPTRYCPRNFGGNLHAVETLIDELCFPFQVLRNAADNAQRFRRNRDHRPRRSIPSQPRVN
jgi:hypothetical protein